MAKVKNTSGQDLIVPWLGGRLVLAGQAVEVPDEDVECYTQTINWAAADDAPEPIKSTRKKTTAKES